MKQDKKSIKARLNKLEREEKTIKKIDKFLTTKRGVKFVSMLHRMPLRELCKYHNAQFMLIYDSDTRNLNLIKSSIRKNNIVVPTTHTTAREAPARIKHLTYLTRSQIAKINAQKKPIKMGFAALMHAYEEHKMDKFKRKHPGPTERELKEDLFPDELVAGYNNMLYIHREHVRNMLCEKYAKTPTHERYFRVFKVLSVTKDPATGREHKPVISEVELDRPFLGNQFTSKKDIATRLKMLADAAHSADSQVIKVKLYTKYGILVRSVTFMNR